MPDLFDIFPDLPRVRRRAIGSRLNELHRRVVEVRLRAEANLRKQKQAVRMAVSRRGARR